MTTKKFNCAIFLISFSNKATYWNLCLYKIVRLLNRKVNGLKVWNKALTRRIDVTIFSGAFYEPKVEMK